MCIKRSNRPISEWVNKLLAETGASRARIKQA
ncbi:hypothetical protein M3J07_009240 [Ascochyta lentis]